MRLNAFILAMGMIVPVAMGQDAFPSLLANGPDSRCRDKLQLFGQFVGSWVFHGIEYHDDGAHPNDTGEIQCRWVLQGRAVQDVFIETSRSDKDSLLYGTTIRFYDPKTDRWRATWVNPGAGVVRTFVGRSVGSEIVMEGSTDDGTPIRWIFSDIKRNSFHWRGEKRVGNGWRIYEELDANRKGK